jgi:transposase
MRTDYPSVITDDEATLRRVERQVRGRPTAVRVQALRLLKSGVARSLAGCASLVGHSPRQVARWWATYRREGLDGVLREPTFPGKTSRLSPEALADLEAVMAEGRIATLKDAQAYLADHHGIVYPSLNGVWAQLRKHQIKLKTGRRRHALADAVTQEAFQAGFRRDA